MLSSEHSTGARALRDGIVGAIRQRTLMTGSLRLLYVDDEPLMCRALVRALKRQPVEIFTAASGREAIELARREQLDLVITDYHLTDITGLEVAAQIRSLHPDAAIALASGFFDWAQREKELEAAGIEYFLPKPWDPPQLDNIIREAFKRKQRV